ARAVVARRRRGQVPAQLRVRRLEQAAGRPVPRLGQGRVQRARHRPLRLQEIKPISASSTSSGASTISECPETGISTVLPFENLSRKDWVARGGVITS